MAHSLPLLFLSMKLYHHRMDGRTWTMSLPLLKFVSHVDNNDSVFYTIPSIQKRRCTGKKTAHVDHSNRATHFSICVSQVSVLVCVFGRVKEKWEKYSSVVYNATSYLMQFPNGNDQTAQHSIMASSTKLF